MSKLLLYFTFLFGILAVALSLDSAFAISVTSPLPNTLPQIGDNAGITIAKIIQYCILITSILAVMAITWWGIKFVLSTGDDEKMKKARYTLIYAFVGLVVAGLAYSIVEMITKIKL